MRTHIDNTFEGRLRHLLESVAAGNLSPQTATETLRHLPFSDLGFAKVDHHRELRQGICEIVYAAGKSTAQLTTIVGRLLDANAGPILVTRADADQLAVVRQAAATIGCPTQEASQAGAIAILRNPRPPKGRVLIVTAGSADLPVAEEAALTAAVVGTQVDLHHDIGVAGLHRVSAICDRLSSADAVVVVAGMEGALASVLGGLVTCPVIACPTSVGYGASFGGLAALLAMLSSCTPGVACVNIDDGVGAGYIAALIARRDP